MCGWGGAVSPFFGRVYTWPIFVNFILNCIYMGAFILHTGAKGKGQQHGVKPVASRQLKLAIDVYIDVYGAGVCVCVCGCVFGM